MSTKLLVGYKLFFGLLGLSAIVTELAVVIERGTWNPVNFFSFFTIESNILAAIALIGGALWAFARKRSVRFDFFRGATTLYMIMTGIIFAVLLSGLEGVELTAVPWDNTVLHYILPVAMVVDWLVDAPKKRIAFHRALIWLVFPIIYLAYSLIRGAVVGWYPYPFLNPANSTYGVIALISLIIALGSLVGVFALTRVGKKV